MGYLNNLNQDWWIQSDISPYSPESESEASLGTWEGGTNVTTPRPSTELTEPRTPSGMKILFLDIETSPSLVYAYQMWNTNITADKIVTPQEVLCFAAKWQHRPGVQFHSQWYQGKQNMVATLYTLLDNADAVVHYNGNSFDIPHINRELLLRGFGPPSPYKNIDLYRVVKKKFAFSHNSMDHVCKQLGLQGKTDKIPFDTWVKVMQQDPESLARVEGYNIGDVKALESLYVKLLPWITNHPNHAIFGVSRIRCPNCGDTNLERRGYAYTTVSKYQRYQCKNCGKWSRDTSKIGSTEIREVAGN